MKDRTIHWLRWFSVLPVALIIAGMVRIGVELLIWIHGPIDRTSFSYAPDVAQTLAFIYSAAIMAPSHKKPVAIGVFVLEIIIGIAVWFLLARHELDRAELTLTIVAKSIAAILFLAAILWNIVPLDRWWWRESK